MKKSAKPKGTPNLDKHLFEAGQQCHKRLWLDCYEPVAETSSARRQEMSRIGDELRDLARTAFPNSVVIEADGVDAAAAETLKQLDAGAPVLFDAAFVGDGAVAQCDILVVHKDKQVDLFEIKSGTKVKHRYVNDLALQATVLEHNGYSMQRAYLLHVNPKYTHRQGDDYPPMQLMRSSDVTNKVQKQLANVARKLQQLRQVVGSGAAPEPPMGTYCESPFPCPHIARCAKSAPALPLHHLPELTRQQEADLHKEGVEELLAVPADRDDLTFRQRRTLQCHADGARMVEPFLQEELDECDWPLHFLAAANVTDPLPIFDEQRPWQRTPYAWAVKTVHEGGRVETQTFAQLDRDDPRGSFVKSLARHLEVGGTAVVWGEEILRELRPLLDSIPGEKASVRALLGQDHLDLRALLESAVFDPELRDYTDLAAVSAALLGDASSAGLEGLDADVRYELVHKARAPRVRAATREKIAATITDALAWQAERLSDLYASFAGEPKPAAAPSADEQAAEASEEAAPPAAEKAPRRPAKRLPKLPG